jgi:hypothetical protein
VTFKVQKQCYLTFKHFSFLVKATENFNEYYVIVTELTFILPDGLKYVLFELKKDKISK